MSDSRFESFQPFSLLQIRKIEKELGRKLPADYCAFVMEHGGAFVGGLVDSNTSLPILSFFAADENKGIISKLRTHQELKTVGMLPIADCELGNLYVLTKENSILYINYYGGQFASKKVADSFKEFLDRIVVIDE